MNLIARSTKAAIKAGLERAIRTLTPAASQIPGAYWNLDSVQGDLRWDGVGLVELARKFGTPTHVFNLDRLRRNVAAVEGPDVFYSYKTHPLPAILQQLQGLGVGAEVISEMELDLALLLGVPPDRIIYNGPAKSDRSIRTAIERDILLLNLNHPEELERIERMAHAVGKRVRVGIRINVQGGWTGQFGTPIDDGSAIGLVRRLQASPIVDLAGLHCHRGSLIHDATELKDFIARVLSFATEAHSQCGWTPRIVDLGGSLATPSVRPLSAVDQRLARTFWIEPSASDPARVLSLSDYGRIVRAEVSGHYRALSPDAAPRVVVELGRALTADTQLLLARVVETRTIARQRQIAIIDAGINLASITAGQRHQILVPSAPLAARDTLYRLAGPICHPGDVLQYAAALPRLSCGDVIAVMDSGAYFEPDSTVFSFPRPPTIGIEGGSARVYRRRETLADVICRDLIGSGHAGGTATVRARLETDSMPET